VHYSRSLGRRYEKAEDGPTVEVFMGMSDRLKRDRSLYSRKNALPGPGWKIVEQRTQTFDWAPGEVREIVAVSRKGPALIFTWYENSLTTAGEIRRAMTAVDTSPWRRTDSALVVRISTEIEERAEGLEEARARLEKFARLVRADRDRDWGRPGALAARAAP